MTHIDNKKIIVELSPTEAFVLRGAVIRYTQFLRGSAGHNTWINMLITISTRIQSAITALEKEQATEESR